MLTLDHLTPLYMLVLAAVALTWLWQVAQSARRSLWPRLGVLMPLGLGALLAAPALDVPALFGVGVGFVLIAAYYPLLRLRPPPSRQATALSVLAVLFSLGLSMLAVGTNTASGLLLAAPLTVLSLAAVLSAALYPRRSLRKVASFSNIFTHRWQPTVTPGLPDLELSLDVGTARLLNVSGRSLLLAGWSPASDNAWLRVRDAAGHPLARLAAGETAYLGPWSPMNGGPREGVRLWYVRDGEDTTYLFRADWATSWVPQGRPEQGERVLN
jgi:hypothetical protein